MSRQLSGAKRDDFAATEEISYPHDELDPSDVEDIIDKLHIGTLKREELKKARQAILESASSDGGDEYTQYDEKDLEKMYRADGRLRRQSSRASTTSVSSTGSAASGSSGERKVSSISTSTQVESRDQEIQTTLGRTFKPELKVHGEVNIDEQPTKRERKPTTKDKMKKLFKRKSTGDEKNGNATSLELFPQLPQVFLVKYMGSRPAKGLWGAKHTRGPVEEVVDQIGKMPKDEDLPLVLIQVSQNGLAMKPHKKNKIQSFKPVAIPIQYISYGLQDTVYPRIFSFIMVREMSSQAKKLECFVYACDSAKNSRKLAAALAASFNIYSEALNGGAFKFTVDVPLKLEEQDDAKSCYDA